MRYLLDTSVYVQPLKPTPKMPALQRWQGVGFEETAISTLTEAEVLCGLYGEGSEQRFLYYQNCLKGRVRVLEVDSRVSRLYARMKARQNRLNRPVSEQDLMIAATAKVHGLVVATLNLPAFGRIEGADWEDWTN